MKSDWITVRWLCSLAAWHKGAHFAHLMSVACSSAGDSTREGWNLQNWSSSIHSAAARGRPASPARTLPSVATDQHLTGPACASLPLTLPLPHTSQQAFFSLNIIQHHHKACHSCRTDHCYRCYAQDCVIEGTACGHALKRLRPVLSSDQ